MRTYAIGDIHGCLPQLKTLVARCKHDCGDQAIKMIFLGDYIDRGPDSRGVVEFLMDMQSRLDGDVICLRGNHEALALSSIGDDGEFDIWLLNGGIQTLRSYGVRTAAEICPRRLSWLRSLPLYHDDGLRFFVHAGINPNKSLSQQDDHDLLWIREPFLSDRRQYERLVVHGHTPNRNQLPDRQANRLNIDTGAYLGGPLTAAVFDDQSIGPLEFLQAR